MALNFCSRPISTNPQVRVLLTEEQLEAIVLLLNHALEMDPLPEAEINITEIDWLMAGLVSALHQISGKALEVKKHPGTWAYLPVVSVPDAIEIIPAMMPIWDTALTAKFFHSVADNLRLAVSFGAVVIDRLLLPHCFDEPMTPQEWLENLFLEAIAFSENRETSQIDRLTATAQAEYDRARAEYDAIFEPEEEEEGFPHPLLSRVEV